MSYTHTHTLTHHLTPPHRPRLCINAFKNTPLFTPVLAEHPVFVLRRTKAPLREKIAGKKWCNFPKTQHAHAHRLLAHRLLAHRIALLPSGYRLYVPARQAEFVFVLVACLCGRCGQPTFSPLKVRKACAGGNMKIAPETGLCGWCGGSLTQPHASTIPHTNTFTNRSLALRTWAPRL